MSVVEDFLKEEQAAQAKAQKIAAINEKYKDVKKDEQGRVGLPMTFGEVLRTYGQAAKELAQESVNNAQKVASDVAKTAKKEAYNTISSMGNTVKTSQPQYKPQTTIAPQIKSTVNNAGDKVLRNLSHMPSAMVQQNINPLTQQKLYNTVSKQADPSIETKREINVAGTRADYEKLKQLRNGELTNMPSQEVERLYTEDLQRKIRNLEYGNTALNAAMLLEIAATLGSATPTTVGQKAVQGSISASFRNLLKKEFISKCVQQGFTKESAELAFKELGKRGLLEKAEQQATQTYIRNKLVEKGIYNQTTNALANSGLNIAKNTAAGAIDLGLLGTGENMYSNYLGVTNNNPLMGGYETVQSAMPYMLGMGVIGESVPYIMRGIGKIPYSSKYEALKNDLRPYKANPNIKYGYNNGKGFYMYDGENIKPSAEKTNTTQPQQQYNQPAQKPKLLTTSGEDISEIAPNIAKKQSANKVTPTPGVIQTPEITQTPQENISDIAPNIAKNKIFLLQNLH